MSSIICFCVYLQMSALFYSFAVLMLMKDSFAGSTLKLLLPGNIIFVIVAQVAGESKAARVAPVTSDLTNLCNTG